MRCWPMGRPIVWSGYSRLREKMKVLAARDIFWWRGGLWSRTWAAGRLGRGGRKRGRLVQGRRERHGKLRRGCQCGRSAASLWQFRNLMFVSKVK